MVTTLCLNPSIDRAVYVQGFLLGKTNRIERESSCVGGKGINVALMLRQLERDVCCAGLCGNDNAGLLLGTLKKMGVDPCFVLCDGMIRTNIKIQDLEDGRITELNEPGMKVTRAVLYEIMQKVEQLALRSRYLVLTGSLPPDCPRDIYRHIAESCKKADCKCILDASGESLTHGLLAAPYLVKPNIQELEQHCGKTLSTLDQVREAAVHIARGGTEHVVVSMGADGGLAVNSEHAYFAPAIKVDVCSTVGAGDAMVAGLIDGFMRGYDLKRALCLGVACSAAKISRTDGAYITKDIALTYADQVNVVSL